MCPAAEGPRSEVVVLRLSFTNRTAQYMPPTLADLDADDFIRQWYARTLKGQLQTFVARGGPEGSLPRLVKTAGTYVRKRHVPEDALQVLLREIQSETVDAFRASTSHADRKSRLDSFEASLAQILCQTKAVALTSCCGEEHQSVRP